MSISASVPSLSPTSSPLTTRRPDTTTSAVDAAARDRLTPPDFPIAARLRSDVRPRDPADEKYKEACHLLEQGKNIEARGLFAELIETFKNDESKLLQSAECNIRIAYTYPKGAVSRDLHANLAKNTLDIVFEWINAPVRAPAPVDDEATIRAFIQMRNLYKNFALLVPPESITTHADVEAKIKYCSTRIPVLTNFYGELERAQDLLAQGASPQAYANIEKVLDTVLGSDKDENPEFIIARARGHLELASEDGSEHHMERAEALTFKAYELKEKLYTNDKAKGQFLNYFIILFEGLKQLIPPERSVHQQVIDNLNECRRELASLPPAEEPTSPVSKATSGPVDDRWKTIRLVFAFSIAAAVIVGAALLGRRLITRLN